MSRTLYWQPVLYDKRPLPDALRLLLAERWPNLNEPMNLSGSEETAICYLEGLRDANVVGAQELLAAVREHGEVTIWLER